LFYSDIAVIILASLLTLFYLTVNILKKFRFGINRLFSVFCITALALYSTVILVMLFSNEQIVTGLIKAVLSIGMLLVQLAFHIAQGYPRWEKRMASWLVLVSFVPGFAVVLITMFTDLIIAQAGAGEVLRYSPGPHAVYYTLVMGLYIAGFIAAALIRAGKLENISFKTQIHYLVAGYVFCVAVASIAVYALPSFYEIVQFRGTGILVAVLFFTVILNYAVYEDRTIDFRRFYQKKIIWATVFLALSVPSYYLIDYSVILSRSGNPIPIVGIALLLFLYLFLFYRFGRPLLENLFRRGAIAFDKNVNEFFQELSEITNEGDQDRFWDIFFERSIYPLETRFEISRASFLIFNEKEAAYVYSFGFGEKFNIGDIDRKGDIIRCLKEYGNLVELSYFFTEDKLAGFKDTVYEILRKNGVAVTIPFFNLENEIIGLLLLGPLKNGRPYSLDLLNALEVYRIQFELSLSNAIMLEGIKHTQAGEHDKLVLGSIKKRIIPRELGTIESIRLSSFYMNNSEQGGDFFDSVILSGDRIGVFICDASDAGVESGLLLLEIYSVLHNQPEKYDTPDKMLNAMNWVISTSRFSEKYVQAFYLIFDRKAGEISFSSAAFNPCVYYDTGKDAFQELDAKGIPLGIDKNFIYEFRSVKAPSGGYGYLYSDGLTSAVNSEGAAYTSGRIRDLIRLNSTDTPAILARKIYNDFTGFYGNTALAGDVSFVIFRTH
jgi:serine phosphatase RsbU (regulator of sigma subunit)